MGTYNFGRIIKSLSSLSNEQLISVRQELDREMQRREIINISIYEEGHRDGFEEHRRMEQALDPIRQGINKINNLIAMMSATAVAGTGELRRHLIHALSGELGKWLVQTDQLIERAIVEYKAHFLRGAIDFTPAHDVLKAAKHFFATGDAEGLFLPPDDNPPEIIAVIQTGRSKYLPGADRSLVIDRLCEKARPYRLQYWSFEEIANQLMLDLQNPKDDDERAELDQLDGWDIKAFAKAFKKRNPNIKRL